MDLALYFRVLWRFRILVLLGISLAFALMLMSTVSLSFKGGKPSFSYRESETWSSDAFLLVSERGGPIYRSILDVPVQTEESPEFAESGRFVELAILYARLATGDDVLSTSLPDRKTAGIVTASAAVDEQSGASLPIVQIRGRAGSPAAAVSLAERASRALKMYVERRASENAVPRDDQVELSYINHAQRPVLEVPRSKVRPAFVFLAVLILTIGLAFVLENLRPRVRPLPALGEQPRPHSAPAKRRSA